MKITISEIEETLNVEFSEQLSQNAVLRTSTPSHAHLKVERNGEEVSVKGEIESTVLLQCSRCLVEYDSDLSFDVDLLYHSIKEINREETHQISEDEVGIGFYRNDELDVTEVVREQIILRLPMKPLCREDCRGLCPVCGIDLNLQQCDCRREFIDPRLEALKRLSSLRKEN